MKICKSIDTNGTVVTLISSVKEIRISRRTPFFCHHKVAMNRAMRRMASSMVSIEVAYAHLT
jgi:hypothetical protein